MDRVKFSSKILHQFLFLAVESKQLTQESNKEVGKELSYTGKINQPLLQNHFEINMTNHFVYVCAYHFAGSCLVESKMHQKNSVEYLRSYSIFQF